MICWLKSLFRGGLAYGPTTLVPKMTTSDLAQGIMHYADDERYMINIDRGIHLDGDDLVPVVVHYYLKDGTVYFQPAKINWNVDTSDKVIIIEQLCKSVRSIAERSQQFSGDISIVKKNPAQPSPPGVSN